MSEWGVGNRESRGESEKTVDIWSHTSENGGGSTVYFSTSPVSVGLQKSTRSEMSPGWVTNGRIASFFGVWHWAGGEMGQGLPSRGKNLLTVFQGFWKRTVSTEKRDTRKPQPRRKAA